MRPTHRSPPVSLGVGQWQSKVTLLPASDGYSPLKDLDQLGDGWETGKASGARRATGSLSFSPCLARASSEQHPTQRARMGGSISFMAPVGWPHRGYEELGEVEWWPQLDGIRGHTQ